MILRALFISTLVFAEAATAYAATAHATINSIDVNGVGPVIGTVTFKDTKYGFLVTPDISGLPIGVHGFHVHDKGACGRAEHEGKITAGFAAGGHYDPEHTGKHLGPYETGGHRGGSAQVAVRNDLVEVVMTIGFRERRSSDGWSCDSCRRDYLLRSFLTAHT